jgi:hypothetical protein
MTPTPSNNLLALSEAIKSEQDKPKNQTLLIYGHPTTGKTRLAVTIAKVPWVKRVVWFDFENGSETLFTMARNGLLTPEEASKILLFKIPDTPESCMAYETALKVFTNSKKVWKICTLHGRADCEECAKAKASFQGEFSLSAMTPEDFVVTDTISQVGDSILNYACRGKGQGFKPGWDEYGLQGRELNAFLTVIQAASYCNFIGVSQALVAEYEELGKIREKIFPLCGTKPFSYKVAKYFGHKIYLSMDNKAHKAGSATTYKMDILTGSRADWRIENLPSPGLHILYQELVKGGSQDNVIKEK